MSSRYYLQEEEYGFKTQQTSETVMHYVHGNTFSFHLSVLTLDTKNVLYLPLWPWKPLSPLCPALYQQFSLTKSDKLYTVNPNIHTMSEYCTVDPTYGFWVLSGVSHVQVMWHIYVSTIWKIIGYWTDYVYTNSFLETCTVDFFYDSLTRAPAFAS